MRRLRKVALVWVLLQRAMQAPSCRALLVLNTAALCAGIYDLPPPLDCIFDPTFREGIDLSVPLMPLVQV